MPKALSEDLRKRAVAMLRAGASAAAVSAHFQVSINSVRRWDKLERETGSLSAGYARCGRVSSIDADDFAAFAQTHAHKTLHQMQAAWGELVSIMTLSRMLRKIGWTHKKRASVTGSAMKPNARHS